MKKLSILLIFILLLGLTAQALAQDPYITIYTHGDREQKKVAVTIDDWYEPELLTDFLDVAKENDARLTFYVVGVNLKAKDKDLWQRLFDEGHEMGNHSNTHPAFKDLGRDRVKRQLTKMEENLAAAMGEEIPLNTLRYPYGSGRNNGTKSALARAVSEAGYIHVVLWDVDSTKQTPKQILKKVKNGSIILLHSNRHDLKIMRQILPKIKEAGYEMVTVSELLGLTKTTPVPQGKK